MHGIESFSLLPPPSSSLSLFLFPPPSPEVLVHIDGWLDEQPLKLVSGPLQSVLYGIREVLESADRNRLLWRDREDEVNEAQITGFSPSPGGSWDEP